MWTSYLHPTPLCHHSWGAHMQVNDMYETLQLNGAKMESKDDVRRDNMLDAAAAFARHLAQGKEFLGECQADKRAALAANVTALQDECKEMAAEVKGARYATFEQDVDVIVEDLRERVAHVDELQRLAVTYKAYTAEFGLPEVRRSPTRHLGSALPSFTCRELLPTLTGLAGLDVWVEIQHNAGWCPEMRSHGGVAPCSRALLQSRIVWFARRWRLGALHSAAM
jgi:hypothetical protein